MCACGGDTTGDTAENTDAQQIETDVVEIPEVEDLTSTDTSTIPGLEDGVLTVGMECALRPLQLDPDRRLQRGCAHREQPRLLRQRL